VKTFYSQDIFSTTALPSKLYCVFFDEDRLNGDLKKSIQVYERPQNATYCGLELDGKPIADFLTHTNKTYATGLGNFQYLSLFMGNQTFYNNQNTSTIGLEEFMSRLFILSYDLTASGYMSNDVYPLIKTGSLRLRMEFDVATTKPMTALVFGISPCTMTIDQNRNVNLSYRT